MDQEKGMIQDKVAGKNFKIKVIKSVYTDTNKAVWMVWSFNFNLFDKK